MVRESHIKEYESKNIPLPGNPSYNEAWALIEAARRIAGVVRFGNFERPEDKRKLRDSLRLNLRIWTIIQAEQTAGENMLPEPIRQNILTLCKFIDNHTVDTMINPSAEKASVLININRNIAAGLLGSTEDVPTEQQIMSGEGEKKAEDSKDEPPQKVEINT